MERQLEPEAMDDELEVAAYDEMGHDTVNQAFVDDFLAIDAPTPSDWSVLDIGTGTAQIPMLLAEACPGCAITAVDLSSPMLSLARRNIERAGLGGRITLRMANSASLPFADNQFDAVISNSLIHHLPEPIESLREAVRVLQPDGQLFIRDLFRPACSKTLEQIVATYAGSESATQQQLLRQSLHAALKLEEVEKLLASLEKFDGEVNVTSDRHWTLSGRKR